MEAKVHHAKTNLSKLIVAAESGEEVIIARNGKPA
jgi:prevent-host-death family protein